MRKKIILAVVVLCVCFSIFGCKKKKTTSQEAKKTEQTNSNIEKSKKNTTEGKKKIEKEVPVAENQVSSQIEEKKINEITVVIDPGHTAVMAGGQEPVGPGASEYKSADTLGTKGVTTGIPEYEFALNLGIKLRTELESRGYHVVMTRETSNLSLSCVQRAEIMNNAGASACIRIHADGSESSTAQGAMGICITPSNPYIATMYEQSRRLSDCVLNHFVAVTGSNSRGIWETDTMSGNNWSKIPVTLLECGFMTNPQEDQKLADAGYQEQMVQGIADGLDEYFGKN